MLETDPTELPDDEPTASEPEEGGAEEGGAEDTSDQAEDETEAG